MSSDQSLRVPGAQATSCSALKASRNSYEGTQSCNSRAAAIARDSRILLVRHDSLTGIIDKEALAYLLIGIWPVISRIPCVNVQPVADFLEDHLTHHPGQTSERLAYGSRKLL